MATTTTSKPNMSSMEARMGPARMANRLAGVTRSRSVTPDRSSKIVLKPGPLPLAKAPPHPAALVRGPRGGGAKRHG